MYPQQQNTKTKEKNNETNKENTLSGIINENGDESFGRTTINVLTSDKGEGFVRIRVLFMKYASCLVALTLLIGVNSGAQACCRWFAQPKVPKKMEKFSKKQKK